MPSGRIWLQDIVRIVYVFLGCAEGEDYDAVTEVLVFNAATTLNTVMIRTRSDNLTRENFEVFSVTLRPNTSAAALTVEPSMATVTIRKDCRRL